MPWQIIAKDASLRVESEGLSFVVSPTGLSQIVHHKQEGHFPITCLGTSLSYGNYYDRYALNRLAEPMPLVPQTKHPQGVTDGDRFTVTLDFAWGDVAVTHTYTACAETGVLAVDTQVTKSGPGAIKVQMLCQAVGAYDDDLQGPDLGLQYPNQDQQETLWLFAPVQRVFDQDGHVTVRQKTLSQPWVRMGESGAAQQWLVEGDAQTGGLEFWSNTKSKTVALGLYTVDQVLGQGGCMQTRFKLTPQHPVDEAQILHVPVDPNLGRKAQLEKGLGQLVRDVPQVEALAENPLRQDLALWKKKEALWYMRNRDYDRADQLLADAQGALTAAKESRPCVLPEQGKVLYENDFRTFPHDWQIFGFGAFENHVEKGFLFNPNLTCNMWTQASFSGSYVVEFDYFPVDGGAKPGGTFLQLSGQVVNPGDDFDFMASANGYMPTYNFGTRCYHFSFCRGDRFQSVCNLRKTGQEFFVLSQVPDPVRTPNQWYRLAFVKNENQFSFWVDGVLVQEYIDLEQQGPFLDEGRVGLRNWGGQAAWFRDFKVFRAKA